MLAQEKLNEAVMLLNKNLQVREALPGVPDAGLEVVANAGTG